MTDEEYAGFMAALAECRVSSERAEIERLLRVIARVRQMADAWERTLPDMIRTQVAAQAIRDATDPARGDSL